MRRRHPPAGAHRRGASLVAVLGALVLVGLLVAAVARDVVRAERASRLAAVAADAPGLAEAALLRAWAGWPERGAASLGAGEARAWIASERGAPARLRVVRLDAHTFQLDVRVALPLAPDSSAGAPRAHRAQALLLGVAPARLPLRGALVAGGDVLGEVVASGRDTVPPGWWCAASDSGAVPAIVAPPGAVVQPVPAPPDSVLRDTLAARPGDYALVAPDSLAPPASAPLVHDGALVAPWVEPRTGGDGACVTGGAAPLNWGDPRRPSACAAHLPVVRVAGDLVAPRGRAQGVLVVEGDLALEGGYEHWGVVVVRGRVRAGGAGDRVVGALLASGGVTAAAPGALVVRHSACAVGAALRSAGVVTPVTDAAWREWW